MKMNHLTKFLLLLSFFVISTYSGTAQSDIESKYSKEEHIRRLKDGVILLKLNSHSKRIESRESRGKQKEANKLKKQIKEEHEKIISGFRDYFFFCKIYYYLSDNASEVIKNQNYSSVFDHKGDSVIIEDDTPIYLIFHRPNTYSAFIERYDYYLYGYEDEEVVKLPKGFPVWFTTTGLFFKKLDYNLAARRCQNTLTKFYAGNG